MKVGGIKILPSSSCHILNYHCCHHRIPAKSILLIAGATRAMVTSGASSSSKTPGEFTTIGEKVSFVREIKKSKFIAIAGHIPDERSAQSFLSEIPLPPVRKLAHTHTEVFTITNSSTQVGDPRATHNCWAYKVGDQYRSNDDGEPSCTAGKPIHSAIETSGLDRVMVVVTRYFGGIKLGTGGLVRAYGGVASECLKNAPTRLVKSKVSMGVEVPFDLLGVLYHKAEDIKQDYDTGKDGITMVTFKVNFDRAESLEEALKINCSRDLVFYVR